MILLIKLISPTPIKYKNTRPPNNKSIIMTLEYFSDILNDTDTQQLTNPLAYIA